MFISLSFFFHNKIIKTRNERGNLTKEFLFDGEQEILKHISEIKKDLREKGWIQRESPEEVFHKVSYKWIRRTQVIPELGVFYNVWGFYLKGV